MLGAIAGDVVGSIYERYGIKSTEFPLFDWRCRFTDDSVLTVAVADVLLTGGEYASTFRDYFHRYPQAGYGESFIRWARTPVPKPYGSYGNGSAMRVSPVGWAFNEMESVLAEARKSAEVTHDHPEGIKGAQAVAAAVFLARRGASKDEIREYVEGQFGYNLTQSLAEIRPTYTFDVSCQGSVPQALVAFLESEDFESAVRNAVSLGGDSDTQACIAGSVAEAFYGAVPGFIREEVLGRLDDRLRGVVAKFEERFRGRAFR